MGIESRCGLGVFLAHLLLVRLLLACPFGPTYTWGSKGYGKFLACKG